MKRRTLLLLFLPLVFMFSCIAQNKSFSVVPYIKINGEKLTLRFSSREQVESLLGKPEKEEYFNSGGEDFNWNYFSVCYYDDGTLFFHYHKDGSIIRITVSSNNQRSILIPLGNIEGVTSDFVIEEVQKAGGSNVLLESDYINYTILDTEKNIINNTFWFNEEKTLLWYDTYYENQW